MDRYDGKLPGKAFRYGDLITDPLSLRYPSLVLYLAGLTQRSFQKVFDTFTAVLETYSKTIKPTNRRERVI